MKKNYNFIYQIGHSLSYNIFNTLFECDSVNVNFVPSKGPFILVSNHVSYFDPFLIGSQFERKIYFFARQSLFKGLKIKSWIMKKFHAIPVDLHKKSDIDSLRKLINILLSNEGILLFPEGTRSLNGTMQKGKSGLGMIACKTKVPIIPIRLFGAFEAWKKDEKLPNIGQRISVVYGKPILPEDYYLDKKIKNRYQMITDLILNSIQNMKNPSFNIDF